jgi:hypothetical protein
MCWIWGNTARTAPEAAGGGLVGSQIDRRIVDIYSSDKFLTSHVASEVIGISWHKFDVSLLRVRDAICQCPGKPVS